MIRRLFASRPGRRSSGSLSTAARRSALSGHRMTVESLEDRRLLAGSVNFSAAVGFGGLILESRATAVDASGNTYVTGDFGGTVNFDSGNTVHYLTASGNKDIYLAKYGQAGNLLWAKDLPGTAGLNAQGNGLSVDANGNVLLTGTFAGTVGFNPGGGGNLTAPSGTDAFVAKYDSNGNYQWAQAFGSSSTTQGNGVAVDGSGASYVVGTFTNPVSFGSTTLDGYGTSAAYLAKLDAGGNVVWAQQIGGGGYDFGLKVAVNGQGRVFAGGMIQGSATAGSTTLNGVSGVTTAFVSSLDTNGNFQWAKAFGGSNSDSLAGLAADASGNVYLDGFFSGTVDFGGHGLTSTAGVFSDVYVTKLDANGNDAWANLIGGSQTDLASDLQVDSAGSVYAAGQFKATTNFNPSGTAANLTAIGTNDGFVAKYDTNGAYQWARQVGSPGINGVTAIAVNGADDVAVVGKYGGVASLGSISLPILGGFNTFVSRLSLITPPPPPVGGPIDFTSASGVGGLVLDARATAVDASGESYVTGYFGGTVNFNTTGGTTALTAVGSKDGYLAKYSQAGALIWVKDLPNTASSTTQGNGLAVDGSGNVVLTGTFTGGTSLNPAGGGSLASAGGSDAFVAKYDANGNYLWARDLGGSSTDQGNGVAVDGSGNAYVAGTFSGPASFGGTTLGGYGGSTGAFVAKLDANGNVAWAQQMGGSGFDFGNKVAVDGSGHVYAAGLFSGSASFGGTTLSTPGGNSNVFVATLDQASGGFQRAVGFSSANGESVGGLAADASGNVYVDGTFTGTASFGGNTLNSATSNFSNVFVTKLDANGNDVWANVLGDSQAAFGTDLKVDSAGSVYAAGQFNGTLALNSGGSVTLTSAGSTDGFVAKFDTNGALQWDRADGGSGTDTVAAIALHGADDVTVLGKYGAYSTFGSNSVNLQPISSTNIYVGRIAQPAGATTQPALVDKAIASLVG